MQLQEARIEDLATLMTWFPSERATLAWGGPAFRYPFDASTFVEDTRLLTLNSFVYRDAAGEAIGFGQVVEKLGRGHLARLAIAPSWRGRGLGSRLVEDLCSKATELFACTEYSLFVLRTNRIALSCYERLGFEIVETPAEERKIDQVVFMVRARCL